MSTVTVKTSKDTQTMKGKQYLTLIKHKHEIATKEKTFKVLFTQKLKTCNTNSQTILNKKFESK